jgi:EAL and modified HD-GYP domain-containing signal transduction protein
MKDQNCLIGRQPILTNNEHIVAYELLFRSLGSANNAVVHDATFSSASVINNTLTNFGIQSLLGEHRGFINLDYELLMSDVLEILPKDQIVLELLESLTVTDELVERCRDLKQMGFTLALDDHEYSPIYHELYSIADIVKVDLIQTPLERVPEMVKLLRPYPIKLLAEKVETRTEYMACRNMKFDYFQGYYFAKPSVLEKKGFTESGVTLLRLMRLLSEDAETEVIEKYIKSDSSLTFKLLVMANSVAFGVRERVDTVHKAISIVGRNQIKRWVQLALFASEDTRSSVNPLIDMAAVRAGLMEQLARRLPLLARDPDAPEKAFLTGILSLLERIYNISVEELTSKLNLADEIRAALIAREGIYGTLLILAEKSEALDFDGVEAMLAELGISAEDAENSQIESFCWSNDLTKE